MSLLHMLHGLNNTVVNGEANSRSSMSQAYLLVSVKWMNIRFPELDIMIREESCKPSEQGFLFKVDIAIFKIPYQRGALKDLHVQHF